MIWLALLAITAFRGTLKEKHAVNVEVAGLYWHFVDIVWIVVFTVVFLLTEAGVSSAGCGEGGATDAAGSSGAVGPGGDERVPFASA